MHARPLPRPAALAALLLLLTVAVAPRPARGLALDGNDPASPLEGAALLLDNGLYVKLHLYPDDATYDDFLEIIERLHTQVRKDRWSVSAQIDAVLDAPPADPVDGPVNPLFGSDPPRHAVEDAYLVPEKLSMQYRSRHFRLEIGDSYLNVGKGIALSLVRRPEIDQDNSLRGLKIGVAGKPADWQLFGGFVNAQNISVISINRGLQLPAGELVFGTAGLVRPAPGVEFGVHAVGTTFDRPDEGGDRKASDRVALLREPVQMGTFGASLRLPRLGPIDWYTEGDAFVYGKTPEGHRPTLELDGEERELTHGYAIYSGAQAFVKNHTLLFEFKRYRDHLRGSQLAGVADNPMSAAPTLELEEAINPDSQHAVTSNSMTGGRVRWTAYVPDTAHNVYVNVAGFVDDADVPGHDREVIVHPYAGVQLFFGPGHHLFVTGGYRAEFNVEDDTPLDREFGDDHMWHLFVDGAVVIKASTLELTSNLRVFHEAMEGGNEWFSSESALSWNYKGVVTVAMLFDATNESSSLNGPLAVPGNLLDRDDPANPLGLFGAAEVTVRPTPSMAVKVFAGANKQGLRCTGGVCRWLPGFSGVRTELTFAL